MHLLKSRTDIKSKNGLNKHKTHFCTRSWQSSRQNKFIEFIVTKHNDISLFCPFSRAQPSLWPTLNRETLSQGMFGWKESKLLKHQISNHEVQWSLQDRLRMLKFWDFISSANLYLSQISYLISAGSYSLRIWCVKSKIPFGCSSEEQRANLCQGAWLVQLHAIDSSAISNQTQLSEQTPVIQ